MTRSQKARLAGAIKTTSGIIAGLALLTIFGIMGGLDHGTIEFLPGTLQAGLSLSAFVFFSWIAGGCPTFESRR